MRCIWRKRSGSASNARQPLPRTSLAMPRVFLPVFWRRLERRGWTRTSERLRYVCICVTWRLLYVCICVYTRARARGCGMSAYMYDIESAYCMTSRLRYVGMHLSIQPRPCVYRASGMSACVCVDEEEREARRSTHLSINPSICVSPRATVRAFRGARVGAQERREKRRTGVPASATSFDSGSKSRRR